MTTYNPPRTSTNNKQYIEDEHEYFTEFINKCLNMNVNLIQNRNIFSECKFNISKLSLAKQCKISKLINVHQVQL